MVIEWLGHSCFLVTLKDGTRVLHDPYDDSFGYTPPDVEADIVLSSHDHFDHNDLSHVSGDYTLINTAGEYSFGELKITGIKTWHDHHEGANRGENIIFRLDIKGITLSHMGDLGHIPDDDVYEQLDGTDILLIPVGGTFTIDANEALEICDRIEPNIIIPMHFKTPQSTMDIATLQDFLDAAGGEYDVSRPGKCYLQIDKASLKKRTRIVVMEHL